MTRKKVAIIGSGNIGTDLMMKILKQSDRLEMAAMVGIDAASDGLQRAADRGVATTHEGLAGLRALPVYGEVAIVIDATSAYAHKEHHPVLVADGKQVIDLTPAAIGPYVVPVVNLDAHMGEPAVNMVTCGGQATIPVVHAVRRATDRLVYAEIVASISSRSAGPGTRANIDEFTRTTARAIEVVGGAERGKAIIILNPADPPLLMRDSVFTLSQGGSEEAIARSIAETVARVQAYVPGYRLKQDVQFEWISANDPANVPGIGPVSGLKTSVFLEVEGAADYFPAYAGNLDIMTSAAKAVAERWAETGSGRGV
ncbi:MAG: acetaldehyde dehydrogenase (acetylating) [Pseudochelatococcus sp.]|jgi:acetaldehyde dehydrogenase|uniref:acetaldehyde dehydrogenase (acetylating) n=1 Tax=Pseudochelatococcus sp. TaxID=2020869 RepID=UPI003D8F612C